MKGTIKILTGGLKMVGSMLPFAAMAGSIAVSGWLIGDGFNSYHNTIDQFREEPAIHEMIESDKALLNDERYNKEITEVEYREKYDYWDDDDNLYEFLKDNGGEYKKYLDGVHTAEKKVTAGTAMIIGFAVIDVVGLIFYLNERFLNIFYSATDDFDEAKEIIRENREHKRIEKELGEYKEEIE